MTRAGWLPLILLAAACGGSGPTRPTLFTPGDQFQLETGPQWLDLFGFGLSNDPDYPACVPAFVPRDGTHVATQVTLEREGPEWVARSTKPATGDMELRFRESGQSLFGRTVTGTIRGWALNLPRFGIELRDVRAAIAGLGGSGSGQIDGAIQRLVSFVLGSVSGEIRFSDRSITEWSTCSKIQWSLQPLAGIGPDLPYLPYSGK